MNRFLDFFRLRHDWCTGNFHWLWWTVTEEEIEDNLPLGPMQFMWDAFGKQMLAEERAVVALFASGRVRSVSMGSKRYRWNEKEQRYKFVGRGPTTTRTWLDGQEITR